MYLSKQWNRGGTLHSTSCSVRRIQSPIDNELLSRLRCVSETAFGYPVVPLRKNKWVSVLFYAQEMGGNATL